MTITTVADLFTAQVSRTPEAVALVAGDVRLTYRQLGEKVFQLAHHLRELGLGPEEAVAISTPRSAEMVVGVLAVMVAGGAFVPVDPSWPLERRRQVREDAGARLVITPSDVDLAAWSHGHQSTEPPRLTIQGPRLAYVIFTSGSTGRPKGAMIRHEAICERLLWQVEHVLGFGPGDASLFKAPLSFDISVNEILLPLVCGGRVVVAEPGGERDPQYLLDLIARERVTFVYLVSSMLDVLLEMARGTSLLSGLKHVWCGGEVLTPELFDRFRAQLGTTLYHGYGPAEATIGVSHVIYRDTAERIATSIGRPNPRTRLYVLDERLEQVPVGETGELYAAGFLLGRGYVNAPSLTGSRFVADPFEGDGSRMYRTGDLARWTRDGSLEFVGRADNQVKIRGMRLELEEVETALAAHPSVRQAAVTVFTNAAGVKQLAGYVTVHDSSGDLVSWCAARLPDYMVPAVVTVLDAFPVTANGKVDRQALPAPASHGPVTRLARTALERTWCEVFASVLGRDRVGAEDDFFALGGDSIIAIAAVRQAQRAGLAARARDLFTLRTPAALAASVPPVETVAAPVVEATGPVPPLPIVSWLQEAGPCLEGFFQSVTVRTPAGLTSDRLDHIVTAVLDAHDALRARLAGWTLTIGPALAAADVITRVGATDLDLEAVAERETTAAAARLDPAEGRMIEVVWLDAGPDREGRLVLVIHHVVVDGVSLRVLLEDLAAAWNGVALPPAPTSLRQWAAHLGEAARAGVFDADEEYWRRAVATPDPMLGARPLDPARDVVANEESLTVELSPEVSARLLGPVPAAIHGGVNDALVAAAALAVGHWRGGGSAVLLELEGHGRESDDLDLSRTFGWFTTLFPAAVDPGSAPWERLLSGGDELGAAVKAVKEQLREVPRRGLSYGALRYLGSRADLAVSPQVLFHYLGRFEADAGGPWTAVGGREVVVERRDPKMPLPRVLEINVVAAGSVLQARFSWPRGVLDGGEVRRLAQMWTSLLDAVAGSDAVTGHTPSDFPLVKLDAADVTALGAELREVLPLTPLQKGLYFHATFSRASDPYVVQQIIDLDGPLDPDRLRAAAERLLDRHPHLRSAFRAVGDGDVVAVIAGRPRVPWAFHDADETARFYDADRVDDLARAQRELPFDLADPPAMRFALVRLAPGLHVLIHTVHHILADGWSVPLMLRELLDLYGEADLPAPIPYSGFLRTLDPEDGIEAWTRALDGVSAPTLVTAALPASHGTGFRRVSGELSHRLRAYANDHGLTLSAVLSGAWGVLLGRLTGSGDVTFGLTVSGRGGPLPGIDRMIGLLINTVPARVRCGNTEPVTDVLRRFADVQAGLMEHEHVSLAELQKRTGPLFDTLVVIENYPSGHPSSGGLAVTGLRTVEAPHYPVTLMARPGERIEAALTYDSAVVDASGLLSQYETLLSAIVEAPSTPCGALDTVAGDQRARLLAAGAGPTADKSTVVCLPAAHPDRVAVTCGDSFLTYAELDARSHRVASALIASGVRRGDVVAVAPARSTDLAVALLAVVRSGAAYLPVDPAYPAARVEFMLNDARPACVLTDETSALPPHGLPTLTVRTAAAAAPAELPVPHGLDAVSVVYTSGSTGRPKAVVGTHEALANRLAWARDHWSDSGRDVRVAKSSTSFIDGTTELLGGLVAGATTVIADDTVAADGAALARLVERCGATQLLAVPSLASALATSQQLGGVRRWILSGEALDESCLSALAVASPDAVVVNSYGSAEVTGDVLTAEVSPGRPVTLGTPVPGARVYLLDPALGLAAPGAVGEVYVGGVQLARGYLAQGGLTATRFVADPFSPGARLYRTGDLGRWTADGQVEFLGRADGQVKINGHRVELGEVEAALGRRPGVAEAVATVRPTASGAPALLGYVVPAAGERVEPAAVLAALRAELPPYLVPASVTVLDRLPLLPNGKRDRAALPAPAPRRPVRTRPATALEELVRGRFAEVLGVAGFGVEDDFFVMGGDSITAIRAVNRLARDGLDLTTQDIFRLRTPAAIAARPREEEVWGLSPLQAGVYYQAVFSGAASTYIAQNAFDLDHRIDVPAMSAAFAALLSRHPTLRASFEEEPSGVVQRVRAQVPAEVAVVDLTGDLDELMRADRERPFDLTSPPLVRLTVVRRQDGRDRLLLTSHFLLWDGWSRELVIRELFTLYGSRGARAALDPPRSTFPDYLAWLATRDREAATAAWSSALSGLAEPTILAPQAAGLEPIPSERVLAVLPAGLTARLDEHARRAGVTLNSLLTAALGVLLGYVTGRTDVVFGTTVAGRPTELPGIEDAIGLFLNTVPARVTQTPSQTVQDLAAKAQEDRLELAGHEHLGLGDIQRGRDQLFDTLYVLQNFLGDDTFTDLERAHGITGVEYVDTTHYPYTWVLTPGANLRIKLEYRPDVITLVEAERLVRRMVQLLTRFGDGLSTPVCALDLTLEEERSSPVTRPIGEETIADLLGHRAATLPDETALVCGTDRLTYAELDARINRCARLLLSHGAGPGEIVALALPRSVDMVVALFAVLRTGAAYLPLDLDHPVERLAVMLGDAVPRLLVTTSAALAAHHSGAWVRLDDLPSDGSPLGSFAPDVPGRLEHPAYVIYTSGSTGRPKGVVTPYRGLTNMQLNHRAEIFDPAVARAGRRLRIAHTVSFAFDMSWEELLWLVEGHEVHVCDEELRRDAVALVAYCRENRIDVINVTPTYAHHLFDEGLLDPDGHRPCLVLLGGEAVSDAVWTRLGETVGYNLYGPTEYTINTLGAATTDSATPTVGRPIWNTRAHILDTWLRPVPDSVVGELYISGVGLAHGYLHATGLTASRFVADPFTPGGRMYRTGDLVRRRPDGNIDFLGRADDQLKIRGYRVEPGEIEAALTALPQVRQAAVTVRQKRLAAYVIPAEPGVLVADLRAALAERLPDYMVPALYGVVAELPLTVNGKLDVAALPEPVPYGGSTGRAPRTAHERVLAAIFAEVLSLPEVGVDDDFFALGGDSISSIAVSGRARRAGLRLTPRDIFRRRTVQALAAVASRADVVPVGDTGVGRIANTPMLAETVRAGTPLSGFYQSMTFRTPAGLDASRLVRILQAVLDRHDLLRARVARDGGLMVPPELANAADLLTVVDALPGDPEVAARLRPEDGIMVQAVWCPDADRLLLAIHHLVVDGVSWRIIGDDLAKAWADGHEPALDEVPTSFRTWSHLVAASTDRFSGEDSYWRGVLAVPDPVLGSRPLDPAVDTAATVRSLTVSLPASVGAALLSTVPAAMHGTVDDVLLTGFAAALGRWRGAGSAVLLSLEGHGRDADTDLSRTVGWFTTIHPVAIDPGPLDWADVSAGGPGLARAAKAVKEQLRTVPRRGFGYGVLRHLGDAVWPEPPQILFNYLGRFSSSGDADWAPDGPLREGVDPANPAMTLEVNAWASETGALTATLSWPSGVLTEEEMTSLADLWMTALTGLTRCDLRGHTPSDFPLVPLTQPDVDRFEGAVDVLPLLPLQEGMYFHTRMALADGGPDPYVVQQIAELTGPLDVAALRRAVMATVHRHDALRAHFPETDSGRVVQVIAGRVEVPWQELDLTHLIPSSPTPATPRPLATPPGTPPTPASPAATSLAIPSITLTSPTPSGQASSELALARLAEFAADELAKPFDLENPPLLRYALVSLSATEHRLIETMHHILADGWSYPLMFRDIIESYRTDSALPAPTVTFRDHVEAVATLDRTAAHEVWRAALAEVHDTTRLIDPEHRTPPQESTTHRAPHHDSTTHQVPRHQSPTHQLSRHESTIHRLSPEATAALTDVVRAHGVTLSTAVHAAWGLLLGHLLDRQTVVFGSTVSGRGGELPGVETIVGLLINTIPLPMSWTPDQKLGDVLTALQDRQTDLLDVQHVGLSELARLAGVRELFDTMVVVENFPTIPDTPELRGFTGTDSPHYPVSLVAFPGERLVLELKHDATLVDHAQAEHLLDGVEHILSAFTTDLTHPISTLTPRKPPTTPTQTHPTPQTQTHSTPQAQAHSTGLTQPHPATSPQTHPVPRAQGHPEALAQAHPTTTTQANPVTPTQAHLTTPTHAHPAATLAQAYADAPSRPEAIAVVSGERRVSYAELDDRSNRLARELIARGVTSGSHVAVALPRSADLIIALLAVVKAGGCYVPLSPDAPPSRLRYILDDSTPLCLLTDLATAATLTDAGPPVLALDEPALVEAVSRWSGGPVTDGDRTVALLGDHAVYVIYTSGSTGRPKGVVVTHRNVLSLFAGAGEVFDFGAADVWTMFHSAAFDFSVWEMWGALLHGARLVVVPGDVARDPGRFHELLRQERVTVLSQTPSAFYPLVEADRTVPDGLALRYVVFGGESLDPPRLADWYRRHDSVLVNMYGITETCVHVSFRPLSPGDADSVIGGALPGLRIHLLDQWLRPVLPGVEGEVYVAGDQLALGYLERPGLTAGRFVADPFGGRPGGRLYRSGDLARWTDDGDLVYLGRSDRQVKVRGYRIELGEIESALLSIDGVANAVVTMREDEPGRRRLVAYLVARTGVDVDEVRTRLSDQLPTYLVPQAFVMLDALPLTVNGKLDRDALPAPARSSVAAQPSGLGARSAASGVAARTSPSTAQPPVVGDRPGTSGVVPQPSTSTTVAQPPVVGDRSGVSGGVPQPPTVAQPPVVGGRPGISGVDPQPSVVEVLCGLFAEVLRLDGVGAGEDFFALGGDSIIAIQLVNLARRRSLRMSPREVFVHRTPVALAEVIAPAEGPSAGESSGASVRTGEGPYAGVGEAPGEEPSDGVGEGPSDQEGEESPGRGGEARSGRGGQGASGRGGQGASEGVGEVMLMPIVQRLAELGGRIDRLNQAELLRTPPGLTADQVEGMLAALVERHDALRLRLHRPSPLLWSLEVMEEGPGDLLQVVEAAGVDDEAFGELVASVSDEAADRLDPVAGEVLRAVLFDRGERQGRLLLVAHHLVIDGVSWRIVVDDLRRAWEQGGSPRLEAVGTSLRTYARTLNEHAAQASRLGEFEHWCEVLAPGAGLVTPGQIAGVARDPASGVTVGAASGLTSATPEVASGLTVGATRDHVVRVSAEVSRRMVTSVPQDAGVDVTEALVAALHLGVARWRAAHGGDPEAPLLLDLERHGRQEVTGDVDLTRTVGWFTTIAPVRLPGVTGDHRQTLREVCDSLRAAKDGGLGYGLLRYCNPRTGPALARLGVPQVLFNYLGRFPVGSEEDWASAPEKLRTAPDPDLGTPYLLEINVACHDTPSGPELHAVFTCPNDAEDLAAAWVDAMRDLTGDAVWPVSPLQEGLFFQARLAGDADVYIAQNAFDFHTSLDPERLRHACAAVLDRHAATRLGFTEDGDGRPVARVGSGLEAPVEVVDLGGLDEETAATLLAEVTESDRRAPFDLARPPLLRLTVVRLPGGRDRLLLTYHLLLWDGWSRELVLRDLFTAYKHELPPPQKAEFTDYLAWLAEQDAEGSVRAWAELLAPLEEPTLLFPEALGTRPVPATSLAFHLSEDETAQVDAAARQSGVTLNAVLGTALGIVLAHATGRAEAVFGTTVAGRPTELDGIDAVVGVFLNTVPALVRFDPYEPVRDAMRRIQDDRVAMMPHEYLGLGDIQRAAGRGELFDSLYVLQNFLGDDTFTDLEEEHGIVGVEAVDATHYPLTWVATPGRRLRVRLEFRGDVVPREQAETLLERLRRVLLHLAADPGTATGDIPIAEAPERGPARPYGEATVAELMAEQARSTPDAKALTFGDTTLTYAELNARVNGMARELLARGAGPERIVALAVPRSIEMVVALFAVLRTGSAYLPLELDYPDARLLAMLVDADPLLLVTTSAVAPRLAAHPVPVLLMDDLRATSSDEELEPFGGVGRLDHPAYVIYTSGSTGRPKGVVTPYRGLTNMQFNHREAIFGPAARGRILTIAHTVSFSFDMSWEELLWLVEGHHVHICDEELRRDARALVAYCRANGVDVVNVTPTYAGHLLDEGLLDTRPVLVLLGGEAVPQALWSVLRDADGVLGYNLYGPTEYTINTLGGGTSDSDTTTVGRPIWNTSGYVLDAWLRPVPPGVPGELYISGDGLARGYLGQAALTAHRFVADPFTSGGRMYRTGDLVRLRPDGNLDFLGRTDDQVKIRGYRVELGEVENAVAALPGVHQCAVLAVPDPSGGRRLAAFLVPGRTGDGLAARVRSELRSVLPGYMVPTAYAVVDVLPLTVNGKLDVAALPEPQPVTVASRPPANETERLLCELFARVLGLPEVGVEDDFFDAGGHSLAAMRLLGAVPADLSLRDLFDARTPERLAARIRPGHERKPLQARQRSELEPLSAAQQRLWLLQQLDPASTAYTYPLAIRVKGSIDLTALSAALSDVVARHEILRTLYVTADDEPTQRVTAATEVPLAVVTGVEAAARPFDLATELPIRALVLPEEGDTVLLLVLHHIAMDEWSERPLLDDLDTAYQARLDGRAPSWEPLPVQYADYAAWQVTDPADLAYWKGQLEGLPEEIPLPADRPLRGSRGAGRVTLELPATVIDPLRDLARDRSATLFMALHAALATLLSRLGGGTDIPIGVPASGRTDPALHDLVGFFVNTVVLRTDLSGSPTFPELLDRVRETDLAAFERAGVPFQQVVEALNPVRAPGRNPLFQVMMGFLHRSESRDTFLGLPTADAPDVAADPKVDLTFTFVDAGPAEPVELTLEYDAARFDEATARRLVQWLGEVVENTEIRRESGWEYGGELTAGRPWYDLLAEHARVTPDADACVFAGRTASYRELDRAADAFAAAFEPGALVGIALRRSLMLPAVLAGVARAGAAYLPLDPSFPEERLRYMVEDARPAVVLVDAETRALFPEGTSLLDLDTVAAAPRPSNPDDPAYVIYTSGSTGRPKGVTVTRRNVDTFLSAMTIGAGDRLLAVTTLSFDIAVLELMAPLRTGACVVLASEDEARDPVLLAELIRSERITHLQATPSLWSTLTSADLSGVHALVGGEALPVPLARELVRRARTVTNLYGPTEATVWVTSARVDEAWCARPTIGRPLPGTTVRVLDAGLRPMPPGVVGEIYIAGPQVASGYLGRPGLTAERFVADPSGGRMYRTGDLARWTSDGDLEFLGRGDHQVKVRGFRIELGEIESVLVSHPEVTSAVAVARTDNRILAYLTTTSDVPDISAYLAARLPAYMVPSALTVLERLPLTPNGKVDRAALPDVDFAALASNTGPRSRTEAAVCRAVAEVLGVGAVGVDDDFFVLGGHSLLLVRLAAALRREFAVDLTVAELFTLPTPAAMASRLDTTAPADDALAPLLTLRAEGDEPPLFCLPPASGLSWRFAGLKRHLHGVPLYGLQSPRLSRTDNLPETIEELAGEYATLIERTAPDGPVRLLGWSFGGAVAHQVATLLAADAREVSFLGMLDTRMPARKGRTSVAELLTELGHPATGEMTVADAVRVLRDSELSILPDEQIARVVENYLESDHLAEEAEFGIFSGDAVFVDAAHEETGSASEQWPGHVAGTLRVHAVACGHSELLDTGTLEVLGPLLADYLLSH
ncbi:amino acid adenylation domain-containing protein [Nonomuraea sp. NPDC050556]|uniref:amino acid adenylation domain-containing protein n=1 Tax=Nonomuraea sp. NPDC050556 TaxID=3364369 RepID=UPI0037A528FD